MHEASVARALIDEATVIALRHRARSIEKIVVRLGRLSGVEPELLHRAFMSARSDTIAAAAALELEEQGLEVACNDCGATTSAELGRMACGRCGGQDLRLARGQELDIVRLDLSIVDEATTAVAP
jgi:hydrogenase nickel incorporation protein HypA/HybF